MGESEREREAIITGSQRMKTEREGGGEREWEREKEREKLCNYRVTKNEDREREGGRENGRERKRERSYAITGSQRMNIETVDTN